MSKTLHADMARKYGSTEIRLRRCCHCNLPHTSMAWRAPPKQHWSSAILRRLGLWKRSARVHFVERRSSRLWHWCAKTRHLGFVSINDGAQNVGHCAIGSVSLSRRRLDHRQSFRRTVTVHTSDFSAQLLPLKILSLAMLCIRIQRQKISTAQWHAKPIYGLFELCTTN